MASAVTDSRGLQVPSGGDWSLHRNAAVFVKNAENVRVTNCTFRNLGGNGILFSNHVVQSTVSDSEFTQLGDSAIVRMHSLAAEQGTDVLVLCLQVLVGTTQGFDGTGKTYPFQVAAGASCCAEPVCHVWTL